MVLGIGTAFVAIASIAAFRRGMSLQRDAEFMRTAADNDQIAGEWVSAISARYDAFQATEQSAAWTLLAWCLVVVVAFIGVAAGVS